MQTKADQIEQYFPLCGACALCGHPDARHRIFDAIQDRLKAGDTLADVADDFDVPIEAIELIGNISFKIRNVALGRCESRMQQGQPSIVVSWQTEEKAHYRFFRIMFIAYELEMRLKELTEGSGTCTGRQA